MQFLIFSEEMVSFIHVIINVSTSNLYLIYEFTVFAHTHGTVTSMVVICFQAQKMYWDLAPCLL